GRAAVATTERTTRLATATRREAEAAGAAAAANQRFARSLGTTATALAVVQGPLGPLSGKLRAASSAMGELTGFTLGLAGLGVALFSIGRTATGFQQIENKLRPLFDTQTQVNKAMDDVVGIATRARTALEPVSSLYMRLTGAAKELAISQSQVGRYTEIISKGAVLSGGSRESQAAGIQQLTQGLGSGLLAGDELRSVKENTFALAQAIAAGFKNADGTIGTTIGHLKELGSAGQLTARQVLEALDRSAYDIERRYAKLPKTLVTSGQEFGNAFMVTIGRLDSAAGFTSTIAEGLSLVSQNLRVILSLAAGVGTAFAAVKAIEMGRTTVTNVGARFRALQQEAVMLRGNAILDRAFAAEAVQNETVRAQATAHSVVGLRAEGAAIESNIAALRAQAVQARETAAAAAASRFGRVAAPGAGPAGISTEQARLRAAAATKALATEEARLAQIHAALLAEERLLTVQTGALTIATQNLARAQMTEAAVSTGRLATGMRFLRTAGMGLVSMLGGPLMIAFTAITAAIYLFVTAETAAEAATRRNEDAQRDFERSIDKTTGKIYEQIGALELQAKAKQQTVAVESSIEQWKHERGQLFARVMPFLQRRRENDFFRPDKAQAEAAFQNRPQAQKDLAAALTRFRDGGSLGEFEKEIRRLAPAIKGLGTALPELGEAAGRVRERAIETDQALARRRVIIGKAKPGDLGVALGTITPGQQIRRKSKAELDREAASQAQIEATNPLIAATGRKNAGLLALEQQRDATGMTDQEYLDQRKQIIATYNSEVKGIQDAKKAQAQARSEEKKAIREARAEEKRAVQEREADEKDEAAGRRDAALLALEERKASLGGDASPEYLNARLAILKTYDDEMERIDSTGQASSTAAARLIADARAIQKAAAAAGEKRRDILGGYGDQPKALARAADQIDDLQRMVNTAVDGVAFLGKTRDEIEQ
ncbi:MAG TPA: tape measure protein, partial [Allosphingosinicella sp.]